MTWFPLSLGAALTQAAQFAVIKGRGRVIPALVIVAWGQLLSALAWLAFFLFTGIAYSPSAQRRPEGSTAPRPHS